MFFFLLKLDHNALFLSNSEKAYYQPQGGDYLIFNYMFTRIHKVYAPFKICGSTPVCQEYDHHLMVSQWRSRGVAGELMHPPLGRPDLFLYKKKIIIKKTQNDDKP